MRASPVSASSRSRSNPSPPTRPEGNIDSAKGQPLTTYLTARSNRLAGAEDRFGGPLAGSFALHAVLTALLLTWAYVSHSGQSWGNSAAAAGSIQATMVPEIPLPPKAPMDQNSVLATENPSPAPVTPAPKTVEVPQPDAIPIPAKPVKPTKLADKTTPAPPLHPQPIQVQPTRCNPAKAPVPRLP